MAWIEVHQALRDHRKTQALAVHLDMPEPHVVGHLAYLWLWALDNAPDGRLPRSARIIARAAWWEGEVDTWVAALLKCGWIDDEDGDLCIHDWGQYAGKLIDQRRASADRQKRFRERKQDVTPPSHPPEQPVTVTSPLRNGLPYRTEPNNTEPTITPSVSPPVESVAAETATAEKVKAVRSSPKPTQSRIPDDFEISDDMAAFADKIGLPPPLVESETEKFLDHFRAKGERKTDWIAAWRNWMRRVGEFQPAAPRLKALNGNRSSGPPSSSGVVSRSDGVKQRQIIGR